jgi:hypothetical protein
VLSVEDTDAAREMLARALGVETGSDDFLRSYRASTSSSTAFTTS